MNLIDDTLLGELRRRTEIWKVAIGGIACGAALFGAALARLHYLRP